MTPFTRPLPRYRCHKVVSALKISHVIEQPGGVHLLGFDDQGYAPHPMPDWWVERHMPQAGGYLVAYEDGHLSYSPAAAFEAGYTPVPDGDALRAAASAAAADLVRALREMGSEACTIPVTVDGEPYLVSAEPAAKMADTLREMIKRCGPVGGE